MVEHCKDGELCLFLKTSEVNRVKKLREKKFNKIMSLFHYLDQDFVEKETCYYIDCLDPNSEEWLREIVGIILVPKFKNLSSDNKKEVISALDFFINRNEEPPIFDLISSVAEVGSIKELLIKTKEAISTSYC